MDLELELFIVILLAAKTLGKPARSTSRCLS